MIQKNASPTLTLRESQETPLTVNCVKEELVDGAVSGRDPIYSISAASDFGKDSIHAD